MGGLVDPLFLARRVLVAQSAKHFLRVPGPWPGTKSLGLFVVGESVLASLSFGVAAVPALVTFVAGGVLLTRAS